MWQPTCYKGSKVFDGEPTLNGGMGPYYPVGNGQKDHHPGHSEEKHLQMVVLWGPASTKCIQYLSYCPLWDWHAYALCTKLKSEVHCVFQQRSFLPMANVNPLSHHKVLALQQSLPSHYLLGGGGGKGGDRMAEDRKLLRCFSCLPPIQRGLGQILSLLFWNFLKNRGIQRACRR